MALFRDIAERANQEDIPMITTDGFEFYERVIGQVFGPACVYGHFIKTRRNNRIVKVERRAVIGTEGRFEERLQQSEDSSTLYRVVRQQMTQIGQCRELLRKRYGRCFPR
jgi:hypothetical protein